MATYIKGDAVENATSYELLENVDGTYNSLATAEEINFEVSALGLEAGDHALVVQAHADGYDSSDYSNEVTYTVEDSALIKLSVSAESYSEYTGLANSSTPTTETKDTHNTFMYVPVEPSTTYYILNGIRIVECNSSKTGVSTTNIYSGVETRYQFTTTANTAYICVSVRRTNEDGTDYAVTDATMKIVE